LAFAPKVKFVMKRKDQMAVKSAGTVAASRSKEDGEDKTESDAEGSDDSTASSTSDDEQESGSETFHKKMTSVADFKASANILDEDDNDDDDDELLIKKTCKIEKHLQLQDAHKAMAKPAKSQVLLAYNSAVFFVSNVHYPQ